MNSQRLPTVGRILRSCLAALVVMGAGRSVSLIAAPINDEKPNYVPGRILIRLAPATSEQAANAFDAGRGTAHMEALVGRAVDKARPMVTLARAAGQTRAQAFQTRAHAIQARFPQRRSRAPISPVVPDLSGFYSVTLADVSSDVESLCRQIKKLPGVEEAEPDYYLRLFSVPLPDVAFIPNDFHVGDGDVWREGSWAKDRPDLYGHQLIQAVEAYNLFADPQNDPGAGIVVAVLDTGVDYLNPDLVENIWVNLGEDLNGNGLVDETDFDGLDSDANGFIDDLRGWDFTNYIYPPQPDNEPTDHDGHGTHCSGTIAARGNNGIGALGVAPNAKIMPVCLGYPGGLIAVTESVYGVLYAAENGADVMSNSWGGPNFGADQFLKFAFQYAHTLGCVCVAAAGNNYGDVANISPASFPQMIAVAATDYVDRTTYFSNFGEGIDVAAPGLDVLSVRGTDTDLYTVVFSPNYQPGERFVPPFDEEAVVYRSDGTSMSGPHVAGLAALVLSARPELGTEEVRQIIRQSADDLGDPGFDIYYGAGRINAKRAVELALLWPDCNANWINDGEDIAAGASNDLDGNLVPDECQDCNANGVFDLDDIAQGEESDCNVNSVPDSCELSSLTGVDCNFNLILDECDVISGTAADCNGNIIPDFCEIYFYSNDCNYNLVPDDCDLADGAIADQNANGIPDECENDCNANDVPDSIDIQNGAPDCDANGVPDECDPDCNDNAIPDACDISDGRSLDCDVNDKPDECDLDCNGNAVPDACDIADGTSEDCGENHVPDECDNDDCNGNATLDECDIASETSADCNRNAVPDECDLSDGEEYDCDANAVPDSCQTDCNDNGIPDACDIDDGTSEDCTGNLVPDECEEDCNENSVADSCDIASGVSTDCDGTLIPDECETGIDLGAVTASNGRLLAGAGRYDSAGTSLAPAGDVNSDGWSDLLIGAWRADLDGQPVGAAYIVFGTEGVFDALALELVDLDGSNGFVAYGVNAYDNVGQSVSAAGDVNADGYDDVVIGGPRASPMDETRTGAAYVIFGAPNVGESGVIEVTSLDGTNGFVFAGIAENDFTGQSVAGIGDVNVDGIDDVIIGAHWADPNGAYSGAAYVLFGSRTIGAGGLMTPDDLQAGAGFVIFGGDGNDQFGISASPAGDLNGDGVSDLAVGANQAGVNGASSGAVYVLFGHPELDTANVFDVADLDGDNGFAFAGLSGDFTGFSVAPAGDLNADGFDDLAVGNETFLGSNVGYVLWGGDTIGNDGLVLADELDGTNGIALTADQAYRVRVGSAGDFNHDGVDDLLCGAENAIVGDESTAKGAAFVIYGGSELEELGIVDLEGLVPEIGFRIVGDSPGDAAGSSVSTAGDFDDDGIADLLVGAEQDDFDFTNSGIIYLLFGTNDCNRNQLPDDCEIDVGLEGDANDNGIPDSCDPGAPGCPGDVNLDGIVDPLDVGAVLSRLGQEVTSETEIFDANGDGVIDPLDTGFILSRFGACS